MCGPWPSLRHCCPSYCCPAALYPALVPAALVPASLSLPLPLPFSSVPAIVSLCLCAAAGLRSQLQNTVGAFPKRDNNGQRTRDEGEAEGGKPEQAIDWRGHEACRKTTEEEREKKWRARLAKLTTPGVLSLTPLDSATASRWACQRARRRQTRKKHHTTTPHHIAQQCRSSLAYRNG